MSLVVSSRWHIVEDNDHPLLISPGDTMFQSVRLPRLLGILILCLLVPACATRVTKGNFDKVKEGMTLAEVEKILGKGTKEEGDGSNVAGQFGVDVQGAPKVGGGEMYKWE